MLKRATLCSVLSNNFRLFFACSSGSKAGITGIVALISGLLVTHQLREETTDHNDRDRLDNYPSTKAGQVHREPPCKNLTSK